MIRCRDSSSNLPSRYDERLFVDSGGLLSYGPSYIVDSGRSMGRAIYTLREPDKLLAEVLASEKSDQSARRVFEAVNH